MSSTKAWGCTVILLLLLLLFLSCSPILVGADNRTHPMEVEALRNIKKSLADINKNLSNWNRGDPCTSHWTGVLCFNTTMDDGYLHVRELQLLNMNLSGTLSPELGRLSYMKILDFMWNNISGSIPREIENIKSLELLLLNGNNLTGSLPEELGSLPKLDRIQIDQNHISGPIPKSFANLNKTKHFHMNNNSISGQIPPELSRLPNLIHFLLDNNNLTGYLPPELSELPKLLILQLDNNNFAGSTIPASYGNMSKLLKLSLRNCSLEGPIPDLSPISGLGYLDLSSNKLNGSIPQNRLALNITNYNNGDYSSFDTYHLNNMCNDLSNNNLTGTIPATFTGLPHLQRLLLANNSLNGSVPSAIWQRTLKVKEIFIVDFQNNKLSNISSSSGLSPSLLPPNVTVWLGGNPLCLISNFVLLCGAGSYNENDILRSTNSTFDCPICPTYYAYSRTSPVPCFCALPLLFEYRLKSPGFSYFPPYENMFQGFLADGLNLHLYQPNIDTYDWQSGPRLGMHLKIFPAYSKNSNNTNEFNDSEVRRIVSMFAGWTIPSNEIFGPYELISFTLLGPYKNVFPAFGKSGISKRALAGIILGTIAGAVTSSAIVAFVISRRHLKNYRAISKRRGSFRSSIKIDGVRSFTYREMASATNNFDSSSEVGQGGYGKVYKGILADGMVVAIKRAQQGSLHGEEEFLTEILFLSRLHHRNLVSLVGYCDEEGEQMLVYEFMTNGTLRDNLSAMSKEPLAFHTRLSIALASSRGILYLHTEADPPVFHRDIKASNILLDHKFTAKVADFGLSRLAPVPDIEGVVPAHVSTVVKGTPGYLDPEYFLTHKLTDKSDIYSLGVVFLELLTGMHPISHGKNIVREVNISYQSGMIFSSIDGRIGSYPRECVEKFIMLALKCCEDEPDGRPSVTEVVRELEDIWNMMPEFDSKSIEFPSSDPLDEVSPPSSSTLLKNPYVSSDVSGGDLVSGAIPTITPR